MSTDFDIFADIGPNSITFIMLKHVADESETGQRQVSNLVNDLVSNIEVMNALQERGIYNEPPNTVCIPALPCKNPYHNFSHNH